MKQNVLVLDANQRSALALTRSLGAKGINVYTSDDTDKSLAGQSRFSSRYFRSPQIYNHPKEYIAFLQDIINSYEIGMIFPMTDVTCPIILNNLDIFKSILLPLPTLNQYTQVTNKISLFKAAEKLSINCPATFYIRDITDIEQIQSLNFPVVIKPSKSKILFNNTWINTNVRYAHSHVELQDIIDSYPWFPEHPFMIQEYIEGYGAGVFALYDQGQSVTFFSHKRLREKPPSGGVSVLSESTPLDNSIKDIAKRILEHFDWNGVAMVEFKITPDGTPYLIEINGRFWGSLQLAIDSGVDFPWLLYQIAIGNKPSINNNYLVGKRLRWYLGDLDRLYLVWKGLDKSNLGNFAIEIGNFLRPGIFNTRYDICRLSDPGPGLLELSKYFKHLIGKT